MSEELKTAVRTCRLLYYGPAESGKRANLRFIHQSIAPEQHLALDSGDPERQIAFSVNHGVQGEWQVLLQAIDAGYESPRAAGSPAEPPFDGIVFVVDSGASTLDRSLAALESLKFYLDSWNLDLMGVPLVLQYNQRDGADSLPVDRLESLINPWGLLSFPADALKGDGVRETLKSVLGLTVNNLQSRPEAAMREPLVRQNRPSRNEAAPAKTGGGSSMDIDYGPPLPGSEIEESTKIRSDAIFDELRPPVVVPVRIPRSLLKGDRPVRILLEVLVDDETSR